MEGMTAPLDDGRWSGKHESVFQIARGVTDNLSRGLAVEQEIKVDQLVDGEDCYISNGVSGFRAGVVSSKKAGQ